MSNQCHQLPTFVFKDRAMVWFVGDMSREYVIHGAFIFIFIVVNFIHEVIEWTILTRFKPEKISY